MVYTRRSENHTANDFSCQPPDKPEYAAKGIKAVLMECGLYEDCLQGKCKKCTSDSCCGKRILELQPDFQQQKSLVQEVIEEAGHLCILLLKFHCELNLKSLSFSGAPSRNIFTTTVITHLTP
jgi:hypothetical protein